MDATDHDVVTRADSHDKDLQKIKQAFHMNLDLHLYNERTEQYFYLQMLKSYSKNNIHHEHVLSQRLSQLSIKMTNLISDQQIPVYLSSKYGLFDQMIKNTSEIMSSSWNIEELRSMATLLHDYESYSLYHHVWEIYMQIGTGQLKLTDTFLEYHQYQSYWPEHIKDTVKCEQITRQRLHFYDMQCQQKEKQLARLPLTIKQKLRQFIREHGLVELRLKCDYAIALVQNEYQAFQYQYHYRTMYLNENQMKRVQSLFDIEDQLEQMKMYLFIERQSIRYNKPSKNFDSLEISLPRWCQSQSIDFHSMIQRTKTNLTLLYIMALEQNIYQLQTKFTREYQNTCTMEKMPIISEFIGKHSKLVQERFQIRSTFYLNYYLQRSFDMSVKIDQDRQGFTRHLIIDSRLTSFSSMLTREQLNLLHRGPTYVAPCQLQTLFFNQSKETILNQQFICLHEQLSDIYENYTMQLGILNNFQEQIKHEFMTIFSTPICTSLQQRAQYEHQLIESIHTYLTENNLIIRRTADQNNIFYLTDRSKFEEDCQKFMIEHQDDFQCLYEITNENRHEIHVKIKEEIANINGKLTKLVQQYQLPYDIYRQLYVSDYKIQLGYLVFLPNLSSSSHTLQPTLSMFESYIWPMGDYLYRLLRSTAISLFDSMKVIQNESDFIQKLFHFATIQHQLRPTTVFVRIQITNFNTMFSNETICDRVGHALNNFVSDKPIGDLSVITIETLIGLFLNSNLFYYHDRIYRLKHGLYSAFPIHHLLLNLALYAWQKMIIDNHHLKTEFVIRCNDELMFTWNHSDKELHEFVEKIQTTYPTILINVTSGHRIQYLQTMLENRQGHLHTSVYQSTDHHFNLILPYAANHAINVHRNWFRLGLCRALQVCSNFLDFQCQRIIMEMTCLSYGYSIEFIEIELNKFYTFFDMESYRFNLNAQIYEKLRSRALTFIDVKRRILDEQYQLNDRKYFLDFSYFYDSGDAIQFEEKFLQHWSTTMSTRFIALRDKKKVHFHPYHVFSLNTRLTIENDLLKAQFDT